MGEESDAGDEEEDESSSASKCSSLRESGDLNKYLVWARMK